MCLISVAVSSGFQNFLNRHYNIEPGGIQEALSLPFQQTARYVKEHEEEVTQEEKEAIKGVLAYNKHPVTYIEATMNQNYYLVYPLVENSTVYDTTAPDKVSAKKLAEKLGVHEVSVIQKLDRWRTGFNKVFFTLPVI